MRACWKLSPRRPSEAVRGRHRPARSARCNHRRRRGAGHDRDGQRHPPPLDAPIVSFGPSDPGKDPVKTVDIERDGPNGQWAILYYTESSNIINRRSQYYIETGVYGATSYWRGVLKINSAIVDQGVIWVDSTTGVYTYQETIRKNGEIIVDMMAHGCVRLDQPDVAAPQTPAVQSTPVPAPEPITAPRERCEQYYGTAACDHAVAPQPLSGMGESAVPMTSDGGTFKVPVTINRQLTLNFVVDSGARRMLAFLPTFS